MYYGYEQALTKPNVACGKGANWQVKIANVVKEYAAAQRETCQKQVRIRTTQANGCLRLKSNVQAHDTASVPLEIQGRFCCQ
jgi:hypothetical protein